MNKLRRTLTTIDLFWMSLYVSQSKFAFFTKTQAKEHSNKKALKESLKSFAEFFQVLGQVLQSPWKKF
jgi:hypothetical protein